MNRLTGTVELDTLRGGFQDECVVVWHDVVELKAAVAVVTPVEDHDAEYFEGLRPEEAAEGVMHLRVDGWHYVFPSVVAAPGDSDGVYVVLAMCAPGVPDHYASPWFVFPERAVVDDADEAPQPDG